MGMLVSEGQLSRLDERVAQAERSIDQVKEDVENKQDKLSSAQLSRISNAITPEGVVPGMVADGVKIATIGGKEIKAPKGGGSVTLDDTVTEKSANGVKSSGIWSWVKKLISGFYTKPSGGIPASDLAAGVVPDVTNFATKDDLASKRDKTDNVCAEDGGFLADSWEFSGDVVAGYTYAVGFSTYDPDPENIRLMAGISYKDSTGEYHTFGDVLLPYKPKEEVTSFTVQGYEGGSITATRICVAKSGESYVTPTGVRNIVKTDQEARNAITTVAEASIQDKVDPRLTALETAITSVAEDLAAAIGEEA